MSTLSLELAAGLAEGLMIGIERGWRLRRDKAGTRVAGVRTYTLLGIGGALAGLAARTISPVPSQLRAIRRALLRSGQ